MNITVQVDTRPVEAMLAEVGRQAPFALALGVTRTVQMAQKNVQNRMPMVFRLRGTSALFRNSVKAKFAKKADPSGNVRIDGPQSGAISTAGRVAAMILRHEEGGIHRSSAFFRVNGTLKPMGFYLPAKGLRTAGANPPRALYPVNIGQMARVDAGGKVFFAKDQKGKKVKRGAPQRERSYFTTESGIYERRVFGSGSAVRLLWAFARTIDIKPRLGFVRTVEDTADAWFVPNVVSAIEQALRTATR